MGDKKTLKAAIVGLRHGHIGSIGPEKPGYIQTFRHLDGVDVVAYCEDTEPERLEPAKTHHPEARTYTSLDDLIEREEFDVAMVGLPANEVPGAGKKLADAGKHFYMEKQFARRAEDLEELVRVINKNGVKVFPGYPWRFHPAMRELKGIIDSGVLGKPLSIETRLITGQVRPGSRDPGAFSYRDETQGGGILHHLGGHHLEAMRFIMGSDVKAVQAMVGRPVGYIEEPLEDLAMVALEYENGAYGSMHEGFLTPAGLSGGGEGFLFYRAMEGWPSGCPSQGSASRSPAHPRSGEALRNAPSSTRRALTSAMGTRLGSSNTSRTSSRPSGTAPSPPSSPRTPWPWRGLSMRSTSRRGPGSASRSTTHPSRRPGSPASLRLL